MAYQGFNSWEMNPQSSTYRRPYQGFNSWSSSPAATPSSGSSLIQSGGGGGGGNSSILNTLLGFSQNVPATPQYELPQAPTLPQYELPSFEGIQQPAIPQYANASTPGGFQAPQLPSVGSVQRPDSLQMPQLQSAGQLSMPTLNYPELQRTTQLQTPGALQMGPSLRMPQLSIPSDIQNPGSVTSPTLAPGIGLSEMAQTTLPYQALNLGQFDVAYNPTQITTPAMGGYGQGVGGQAFSSPMNVNTGMTLPQAPGGPQAGAMGSIEGMGPRASQASQNAAMATLQPQMMQQQADYLGNLANYNLSGQQVQSQAGLNWANLAQLLQQAYQNAAIQGQGNTLSFLGGMSGII